MQTVTVGVIDSGGPAAGMEGALAFLPDGGTSPALPDRLGHGTAVARTIMRACAQARIIHAQVFEDRPVTTTLQVAAALRWFARAEQGERVDLVCLSLGLAADRAPLRAACEAVREAGIIMVAAHPARGAPCYPAAYEGVIAGTGDARCGWDDLSQLGPRLFGAWCNSPEQREAGTRGSVLGGASLGSARVAGHIAQDISLNGHPHTPEMAIARLSALARHFGAERKKAGSTAMEGE